MGNQCLGFSQLKSGSYWAWAGSFAILSSLWIQVQIDVKINNEWFGQFYDMIQKLWGNQTPLQLKSIGTAFLTSYY